MNKEKRKVTKQGGYYTVVKLEGKVMVGKGMMIM